LGRPLTYLHPPASLPSSILFAAATLPSVHSRMAFRNRSISPAGVPSVIILIAMFALKQSFCAAAALSRDRTFSD
jgi:hypothetical protein